MVRSKNTLTLIATVLAISCIVIMFLLGFWQLDRKSEKEARLEQISQRQESNPLRLEDLIDNPEKFVDFPLMLTGELSNQTFFIDNKLKNGVAGYEVLSTLRSDYGVVLINLGWVPGTGDRSRLPEIILPNTSEHLGLVYVPQDNIMVSETNSNYGRFPVVLQQIDIAEIEQHLGEDVLPFTLRLNANESTPFLRQWEVVNMPPERHLGYAIQWFGLGVAGLTVFLLTIMKSMQRR
uniref:SURF1 family protein n=1 Tax=Ningiella ruwaisensis TaxID=2364274 RepID=UPI0010A033A5|nr:SURF1 family protein [Ningiella ruwaisensis]